MSNLNEKKAEHKNLKNIVKGAVGPFEKYCDGYGNPGASGLGYITTVAISTGLAPIAIDTGLDKIEAFDQAAVTQTNTGQVNFLQATSFSGINGAIWGYDLVKPDSIKNEKPLIVYQDGLISLPIYDLAPLLEATQSLIGTVTEKRFPILPGALVSAAMKGDSYTGPCTIWGALSLSISKNRDTEGCLFLEDMGTTPPGIETETHYEKELQRMGKAIIALGKHHQVEYEKSFFGYVSASVPVGYIGAVKLLGPYLVLPKQAIPKEGPEALIDMSLSKWKSEVLSCFSEN